MAQAFLRNDRTTPLQDRIGDPDNAQLRAALLDLPADPAPRTGGGNGSLFARLFDFLFGWLRSDDPAPQQARALPAPMSEAVSETVPETVSETTPDLGDQTDPTVSPVADTVAKSVAQSVAQSVAELTSPSAPTAQAPEQVGEQIGEKTDLPAPAPMPTPVPVVGPVAETVAPSVPTPTPPAPAPQIPDGADSVTAPAPVAENPVLTTSPDAPITPAQLVAPALLDATTGVAGGRVTTLMLADADSITGVTIDRGPAQGHVTVNPDFTLALVLSGSDYSGPLSFDYTVTRTGGSPQTQTATLDVAAPTQGAGWGLGNHYMLEAADDGKLVVEYGDNHRKVYVSGSDDALTRADIAALEGVDENTITAQWLRNNPEYGGSEDMALASDVGMTLWYAATAGKEAPSSNWLLFERGYSYTDVGQLVTRGLQSESELHPVHITAWGEGARPVLDTKLQIWQRQSDNVVVSDLTITDGARILGSGDNLLLSHINFLNSGINVQNISGFTLRYSEVSHNVGTPPPDGEQWGAIVQGVFATATSEILMEGNIIHHNGWADDYRIDGDAAGGMAPNMFTQNIYLQYNTTDVTFRDNIVAQGASHGAQFRGGAFVENNLFLDNNIAFNTLGGNYEDHGFIGNYTLVADNVITSAGYKVAPRIGALQWGVINNGLETTWSKNIVAHLANPDDPAEQAWKVSGVNPVIPGGGGGSLAYDDTIVFNWNGSQKNTANAADANTDGLDIATAMATTIQRYAAAYLDQPLSRIAEGVQLSGHYQSQLITDLMNTLMAERDADGATVYAVRDIIDYFQQGFNIAVAATNATQHRFIPDDLGDGVRWDNRLNWAADQLPDAGDSVDLGGNRVNFAGTVALDRVDLGTGGALQVGQGKLSVTTLTGDGTVFVTRAGQLWTDGTDGAITVAVDGGRFANTGTTNGPVTLAISGGQAVLAADDAQFTLGQGATLRIDGTATKVGFDGDTGGIATLVMQDGGTLGFVASADGLGGLREFRSGAWDQAGSDVRSGVVLDGTLALDLGAFIGIRNTNLIQADAITGLFDDITIRGLGSNRDALISVDYDADLVTLSLTGGTGQARLVTSGDAGFGGDEDATLWDRLDAASDGIGDATITLTDDPVLDLPDMDFI